MDPIQYIAVSKPLAGTGTVTLEEMPREKVTVGSPCGDYVDSLSCSSSLLTSDGQLYEWGVIWSPGGSIGIRTPMVTVFHADPRLGALAGAGRGYAAELMFFGVTDKTIAAIYQPIVTGALATMKDSGVIQAFCNAPAGVDWEIEVMLTICVGADTDDRLGAPSEEQQQLELSELQQALGVTMDEHGWIDVGTGAAPCCDSCGAGRECEASCPDHDHD